MSAGNLHTQVLANAIANLPIHGKSILSKIMITNSLSEVEILNSLRFYISRIV